MDYDFRNNKAPPPPYDSRIPMYRPSNPPQSSSSSPHISNFYPRVGQSPNHPAPSPPSRNYNIHQHQNNPPPSSSGLGIRVMIKPEYRISQPPQLSPLVGDIPRSTFQFDFDFEKKILAEAEKGNPNWTSIGTGNSPLRSPESRASMSSTADPVISKYISLGLSREAVPLAVANYGDNPTKVREFVDAYNPLREMGFPSSKVAEALAMYDNDTDKALAYFLNNATS